MPLELLDCWIAELLNCWTRRREELREDAENH
jgi:hypothetical protein